MSPASAAAPVHGLMRSLQSSPFSASEGITARPSQASVKSTYKQQGCLHTGLLKAARPSGMPTHAVSFLTGAHSRVPCQHPLQRAQLATLQSSVAFARRSGHLLTRGFSHLRKRAELPVVRGPVAIWPHREGWVEVCYHGADAQGCGRASRHGLIPIAHVPTASPEPGSWGAGPVDSGLLAQPRARTFALTSALGTHSSLRPAGGHFLANPRGWSLQEHRGSPVASGSSTGVLGAVSGQCPLEVW